MNKYINFKIKNTTEQPINCYHTKNESILTNIGTTPYECAITRFSLPISNLPIIRWDDSFTGKLYMQFNAKITNTNITIIIDKDDFITYSEDNTMSIYSIGSIIRLLNNKIQENTTIKDFIFISSTGGSFKIFIDYDRYVNNTDANNNYGVYISPLLYDLFFSGFHIIKQNTEFGVKLMNEQTFMNSYKAGDLILPTGVPTTRIFSEIPQTFNSCINFSKLIRRILITSSTLKVVSETNTTNIKSLSENIRILTDYELPNSDANLERTLLFFQPTKWRYIDIEETTQDITDLNIHVMYEFLDNVYSLTLPPSTYAQFKIYFRKKKL